MSDSLASPPTSMWASGWSSGWGPWVWLLVAGLLEIAWATGLKQSAGFTRLWPSIITVVLMILSFVCLAQAIRVLPIGTGYAVWTGIGTVGAAIVGVVLFREPVTALRIACVLLIVLGIVGLKLTSS